MILPENNRLLTITLCAVLRSKAILETDPVLRETETESDCLADRAAALDEQKVCPSHRLIIKEQTISWNFFAEWSSSVVCARMHDWRPLSTDPVLWLCRLLLVRARRHRQEYTWHINKRRPTGLCNKLVAADEGLSRTTKTRIPQRAERVFAFANLH